MKVTRTMLTAGALLACTLAGRAELVDAIWTIVDDSLITQQDVQILNDQTERTVRLQYGSQPAQLEKELKKMTAENLETLVQRRLILHEFKTAGYILPDSLVDELVQEAIRSDFSGSRVKMTKTLEAQGITFEKFRQEVRERFIIQQMNVKNVASEIIISPHKVEAYYLAHRDEYNVEDEAKLRMIVLRDSSETSTPAAKRAEDILTELDGGAAFEQMATLYSQGSQRGQGGDWGWWERSKLTKGLADIAFSLPVGKHSAVFSRSLGDDYWVYQYEKSEPTSGRHYGVDPTSRKQILVEEQRFASPAAITNLPPPAEFYLMLVEDRRTTHFRSLSEVSDEIERNLLLDEQKRIRQQWIDRLKKKTFVRSF
jgi:peptidyl-prolyl cis-trans isomerase SurA